MSKIDDEKYPILALASIGINNYYSTNSRFPAR
jgi:hypothetical protein